MKFKEKVTHIYFLQHGYISLYDQYYNLLTQYSSGSFIGEFQILLGLSSGANFKTNTK